MRRRYQVFGQRFLGKMFFPDKDEVNEQFSVAQPLIRGPAQFRGISLARSMTF
jgi:hypothetical protein